MHLWMVLFEQKEEAEQYQSISDSTSYVKNRSEKEYLVDPLISVGYKDHSETKDNHETEHEHDEQLPRIKVSFIIVFEGVVEEDADKKFNNLSGQMNIQAVVYVKHLRLGIAIERQEDLYSQK